MPTGISKKVQAIAPSATLSINAKAKQLRSMGVDVISFAVGEPDFETPEPIRNAMKDALDRGMTRYTPVCGTKELREAIAYRQMEDHGLKYGLDEIIVCNGAKHALYNAFQAILDLGDEVIVDRPCWVSYPEMVRMAGGTPVFADCPESQGFLPTVDQLATHITPRTKAFVLNTPSNPNGCVWTLEHLQELARLAVERDFYIIADEIYEKLVYDDAKHYSIATFSDEVKRHTILINGVSKSYAMTGFRIGYAAANRDIIEAMSTYQSQATAGASAPAQHAAAVALTMDQSCVEEMRQAFEFRRNLLVQGINEIDGLSCRKPSGAFYVMINISRIIGKHYEGQEIRSSLDFASLLLDKAHVALVPGAAFMAEGFCRISYACSAEQIREGLDRITRFVKELK